jgi:hypothetical protein
LVSVSRVHVKKDEDFEHPPGGYRPWGKAFKTHDLNP